MFLGGNRWCFRPAIVCQGMIAFKFCPEIEDRPCWNHPCVKSTTTDSSKSIQNKQYLQHPKPNECKHDSRWDTTKATAGMAPLRGSPCSIKWPKKVAGFPSPVLWKNQLPLVDAALRLAMPVTTQLGSWSPEEGEHKPVERTSHSTAGVGTNLCGLFHHCCGFCSHACGMFEGTREGKQNGLQGKTHVSLNIILFIYPI